MRATHARRGSSRITRGLANLSSQTNINTLIGNEGQSKKINKYGQTKLPDLPQHKL